MNRMEEELRQALQRKQPSADFVARVMARLEVPPPKVKKPFWLFNFGNFQRPALHWAGAILAICLLLSLGGLRYQHYLEENREGEAAKTQVIRALQIASSKLNRVQHLMKNRVLSPDNKSSRTF
jgi:hypothetical protein